MEWETSKENFQPMKQGRDPESLKKTKDDPVIKYQRVMVEQERRCVLNLERKWTPCAS